MDGVKKGDEKGYGAVSIHAQRLRRLKATLLPRTSGFSRSLPGRHLTRLRRLKATLPPGPPALAGAFPAGTAHAYDA